MGKASRRKLQHRRSRFWVDRGLASPVPVGAVTPVTKPEPVPLLSRHESVAEVMMRLVGGRRGRRQRLLALVRARLERFGVDHDPATVLDPEAVAELTALLETVPDPAADLEIAHAAGWLHWLRYLVLDPGDDQQDLADALALFVPVYQARPDAVPDQVRTALRPPRRLRRSAGSGGPRGHPAARDATYRGPGRAEHGDRPAPAGGGGQPGRPPRPRRMLSNLGAALRTRFERTGDRADLDAAIDAGRQAVAASPADHPDRAGCCPTSASPCGPGLSGPGTGPTWTRRSTPASRRWRPARPATPTAPDAVQPRRRPADPV